MNGVADKIIAHYQRHAAAWDADRRGAGWSDKRWHDRFIGLLPSPAAVLDLGCGGGSPVAVHLVAHCMRVTGIYRSPALIELCRERLPDQNWLICDMRKLNLSRTFDGILAWDSFFHLCPDRYGHAEASACINLLWTPPNAPIFLAPSQAVGHFVCQKNAFVFLLVLARVTSG